MEEVLKSSTLLLIIVILLYVVITGLKMTERMRVMLVYLFSFVLALAGSFRLLHIVGGAVVVLFLALEFLTDDTWRLQLFTSLRYKLADFLYRMFVEYSGGFFLLAMAAIFIAHNWHPHKLATILLYTLSVALMAVALFTLTAKKYATKSITAIVEQLERDMLTYQLSVTPHMQTLFNILVDMEDRAYFNRTDHQHVIPFVYFLKKCFSRLRYLKLTDIWPAFRSLFTRGYGTIEMQLLRNIGIEYGYQYTYRRKIFELVYANMFFNGYRAYLVRGRGDYSHYRAFIIRKYIENVDSSVNGHISRPYDGRSSLLRMFGRKNLARISKEEFFVWCLGLPQRKHIYDTTVDSYDEVMTKFGLDRQKIDRLLARFN